MVANASYVDAQSIRMLLKNPAAQVCDHKILSRWSLVAGR
jgi:hypothetical protein